MSLSWTNRWILTFHERQENGDLTLLDRIQCPQDRPDLQEFLNIDLGRLHAASNNLEACEQKYEQLLEKLETSKRGFITELYKAHKALSHTAEEMFSDH